MSWMEIVNSSAASKSDESPSGCVSARSLAHSHSDLIDYPPCSWAWQMRWAAPTSFLRAGATLCGFGRAEAEGHAEGRSLAVSARWFIALRQSLTASRSSAARPWKLYYRSGGLWGINKHFTLMQPDVRCEWMRAEKPHGAPGRDSCYPIHPTAESCHDNSLPLLFTVLFLTWVTWVISLL